MVTLGVNNSSALHEWPMQAPAAYRSAWTVAVLTPTLGALASAIVLGLGGYCFGRLARSCSFPRVSGFVAFGCFAVNSGLLTRTSVEPLRVLVGPALGTIAIAAGAELRDSDDGDSASKGSARMSFALTLYASTFVITFVSVLTVCRFLAVRFAEPLPYHHDLAAALICAGISTARSPASALAVVKELGARGSFTSCCLQASILLDAFTVFAFPFLLATVLTLVPGDGADADGTNNIAALAFPVYRLCISLVLGHSLSVSTASIVTRLEGFGHKARHSVVWKFVLILVCWWLFSCSQRAEAVGLVFLCWEPMLVCLVLGAGGLRRQAFNVGVLVSACEGVATWANLCFFVLAGASLELRQAMAALAPAVGLTCIRIVGLRLGSSLGASIVGGGGGGGMGEQRHAGRYWMGFVTQAGISVALITEMRAKLAHHASLLGEGLYSVLLSSITINQVIGPPLFKRAIGAAGEAHIDAQEEEEVDALPKRHTSGISGRDYVS